MLADGFKATLGENDWRARIANVPGAAYSEGVERKRFWRHDATLRAQIDLKARLRALTATTYSEARWIQLLVYKECTSRHAIQAMSAVIIAERVANP